MLASAEKPGRDTPHGANRPDGLTPEVDDIGATHVFEVKGLTGRKARRTPHVHHSDPIEPDTASPRKRTPWWCAAPWLLALPSRVTSSTPRSASPPLDGSPVIGSAVALGSPFFHIEEQ